jgi:hypothetical protein
MLAQQVAAGDVRDAEPRGEPLGLCSLSGAGSADQQTAQRPPWDTAWTSRSSASTATHFASPAGRGHLA